MPQLRIRDVDDKVSDTNAKLAQVRNIVYVLAVVQFGLVAHALFTALVQ